MRHHAGDPLAGLEGGDRCVRGSARWAGRDDTAGEVGAERERGLGTQLVLPLAEQQVREGDADGMHLDQDVARPRDGLRDLPDLDP